MDCGRWAPSGANTQCFDFIVINNKGGQIFSKLSYSNKNIKDFQKYWITPPKTKIKDLADLYKIKYYYRLIENW